ncbi:UbiH/UbiF/VisC/COQ6 family ubiquinone biosynthesis hydroxylase [Thiomicrorhabdus lithotrophica]|uniref:UbiH/UbiF/VisC/COQ6 family ubiquinone biosynthesis hydroxylase n=1 Tax=Thiomicrorhabdus lithotrophica TaxID=2949997 RepID=A0ABY8CBH8_9GAMM|nr:UbiH/UbiF/VisC/COQ6 family ubiquinone biosynthesis hydroxylase [Thiomicrorhabdus lithotrophica]WEJ61768.1 UbiH/UbiF/VisC/COQ6 family ubiquinone biosynthesis hydroxylase [Thiomicrorhabdus lithotrophica]
MSELSGLSDQSEAVSQNLTKVVWDTIVVGGGMVGAATALGLGQQGMRVLLLEKQPVDLTWQEDLPYQVRVSALTRASEKIIKNLGAWQGIESRRYHPFFSMRVWDELTPGEVLFSANDMNEANLGYTVENNVIQAALWEQVNTCENIEVLLDSTIESLSFENNQAWLSIEGIGLLKTELVIGADGAFSKIRQLANIGLDTHDYEQCAVVGCVKTERSHEDTCWQRYTHDGPFAFLSMGNNVSSIAWYLPTDKMQWALNLSDEAFAKEISKASDYRLGQVIEVAERGAFSLIRRHAEHYVKPNLALVGDAAHTIHPQAGQGVNLGLLDAAALVETVLNARQGNKAWGSFSVLRKYERWRRGDNALVQRSMEGFDWLFKQDASLKAVIRKPLLPLANKLTFVKNWLMGQALNGREALPKLAKTFPKS